MILLLLLLSANPPPPGQPPQRVAAYDGGEVLNVTCINCSGGGVSSVYVLDAGVLNVQGAFFQATQPVSLASVPSHAVTNAGTFAVQVTSAPTTAVTGPVTDTQLRATPVPVSGTVTASGPLTDTQLRASAVPISGTVTASGPLTDTQLRATAVPVSVASVPTHSVTQSGTWTVQPGNTANTTAWKVDGSAVTQPVSGTFWQATQPVSGTVTCNAGSGTLAVSLASAPTTAVTGTFWQTTQPVSIAGSNPCQSPSATLAAVAGATSGTSAVQLVGLSGTTKIYLCTVNVTGISGTTPTFSLKYGTGTACATGGVTILGPWTTAANTVYSFNQPFVTPAGQELCYVDTGTSPVQNYAISYVQQ